MAIAQLRFNIVNWLPPRGIAKRIEDTQLRPPKRRFFVVPQAGLEPARYCEQQILSLNQVPNPSL
jgi:hypothetical protein